MPQTAADVDQDMGASDGEVGADDVAEPVPAPAAPVSVPKATGKPVVFMDIKIGNSTAGKILIEVCGTCRHVF